MKHIKVTSAARTGLAAITTVALAATLSLTACAPSGSDKADEGSSAATTELSETGASVSTADPDRVNAKTVIRAASDLFTMLDMGLTDADSGCTISMSDAKFSEFFNELKNFRDVADLDVSDASFTVNITAVNAATARGVETNYRFTINNATVTVNGKTATYDGETLSMA